jgi:hypothetical protein
MLLTEAVTVLAHAWQLRTLNDAPCAAVDAATCFSFSQ